MIFESPKERGVDEEQVSNFSEKKKKILYGKTVG